jgi:hypothetical protein
VIARYCRTDGDLFLGRSIHLAVLRRNKTGPEARIFNFIFALLGLTHHTIFCEPVKRPLHIRNQQNLLLHQGTAAFQHIDKMVTVIH